MELNGIHPFEAERTDEQSGIPALQPSWRVPDRLQQNLRQREIPSLYGLRGVAAIAIVCWHFAEPFSWRRWFPGPFAVTLFFELSGLLITTLFLRERERTGTIAVPAFFRRRALRLLPAFYAMWALCRWAGAFPGEWFHFFYLGDYYTALTQRYSAMTPAWSLGVEEKFYLLWPIVFLRVSLQRLRFILVLLLIGEPVYRFVLIRCGFRAYTSFAFETHLDALVLGCLLAIVVWQGWRAPKWMVHPLTPVVALIGVFLVRDLPDVAVYVLAVLLVSVLAGPPRFLNHRAIRFCGAISYSLYLSHMYAGTTAWSFLFGTETAYSGIFVFCSKLLLAFCVALGLYVCVERPFLRLKQRPRYAAFGDM